MASHEELNPEGFKDDLDSLIQKLSKELDVARKTPARSIAEQNVQETTGAENTFVTNLFGAFGSVIGQRLANIGARNPPPVPTLPPTGIAPTPVRSSPQPLDITGPWRSNDGSTLVVMQRGSQISVQTIDPFGRVIMQGQGSVGANVAEIVYNAIFPFPSRGQAHFDISPDGRHMRVRTKNYHTGNASVFDVFR